jgi:hypothetical protein
LNPEKEIFVVALESFCSVLFCVVLCCVGGFVLFALISVCLLLPSWGISFVVVNEVE